MSERPEPWAISQHARPKAGESECGDACLVWRRPIQAGPDLAGPHLARPDLAGPDRMVLALADGLGHGPEASHAARSALRCVGLHAQSDCEDIFRHCDQALQSTRGAAMALALIDPVSRQAQLASVGNVRTVLLPAQGRERRYAGARGIVGGGYGCLAPESVQLRSGDVLALFSDGLDELLPLGQCLQGSSDFEQTAEAVLRQWALPRDDAAILLLRVP